MRCKKESIAGTMLSHRVYLIVIKPQNIYAYKPNTIDNYKIYPDFIYNIKNIKNQHEKGELDG
jgi:hypothetical protein